MPRRRFRPDESGQPWWGLLPTGVAYAAAGAAAVYAAGHVDGPWRVILQVSGLVAALAGGWCALWFVGFGLVTGMARTSRLWLLTWLVRLCLVALVVAYYAGVFLLSRSS